jgi:hypothetical protein
MANPVVAPPGDVRHLLGDKVKTIGGTPYANGGIAGNDWRVRGQQSTSPIREH